MWVTDREVPGPASAAYRWKIGMVQGKLAWVLHIDGIQIVKCSMLEKKSRRKKEKLQYIRLNSLCRSKMVDYQQFHTVLPTMSNTSGEEKNTKECGRDTMSGEQTADSFSESKKHGSSRWLKTIEIKCSGFIKHQRQRGKLKNH